MKNETKHSSSSKSKTTSRTRTKPKIGSGTKNATATIAATAVAATAAAAAVTTSAAETITTTETTAATATAASLDSWARFEYGIKSPKTREKYRRRLANFFDFLGEEQLLFVPESATIQEKCTAFANRAKDKETGQDWVFDNILRFAKAKKEKVEEGKYRQAPSATISSQSKSSAR